MILKPHLLETTAYPIIIIISSILLLVITISTVITIILTINSMSILTIIIGSMLGLWGLEVLRDLLRPLAGLAWAICLHHGKSGAPTSYSVSGNLKGRYIEFYRDITPILEKKWKLKWKPGLQGSL